MNGSLESEARTMFEADPSSKWEANWENLAQYKRDGWIRMAEVTRKRFADNALVIYLVPLVPIASVIELKAPDDCCS